MKNSSILKGRIIPSMVAAALAMGLGAAGVAHAQQGGMSGQGSTGAQSGSMGQDKDRGEKRHDKHDKHDKYDKKGDRSKKDMDGGYRTGGSDQPNPKDYTAPKGEVGGEGNQY